MVNSRASTVTGKFISRSVADVTGPIEANCNCWSKRGRLGPSSSAKFRTVDELVKVIQCGFDPLFSRIPIRGFPCDLGVTGGIAAILEGLARSLEDNVVEARIIERRKRIEEQHRALVAQWESTRASVAARAPIHPAWAVLRTPISEL